VTLIKGITNYYNEKNNGVNQENKQINVGTRVSLQQPYYSDAYKIEAS
jgi:hypothetical protein